MNKLGHFLKQCDVLVVGKFACIKVHAMLRANLVTNVGLIGIFDVLHRLAAARARTVCNIIIRFTGFSISRIREILTSTCL